MSARVRTSLQPQGLAELACAQVNALFADGDPVAAGDLAAAVSSAMKRLEQCFSRIDNKYFFDGTQAVFDHLHGDQYAMWLYLLSNELFKSRGPTATCKKLFLLNKALHGCDVFYEVELPSTFLFVHPLGTVLGRANYGDNLIVYQRVGVGSNHDVYPKLGRHVTLRPGSSVLGACVVGDHCSIAAESLLLDRDLPAHSLYIGNPRSHEIRASNTTPSIWRS